MRYQVEENSTNCIDIVDTVDTVGNWSGHNIGKVVCQIMADDDKEIGEEERQRAKIVVDALNASV